jgi:hypothetical protein
MNEAAGPHLVLSAGENTMAVWVPSPSTGAFLVTEGAVSIANPPNALTAVMLVKSAGSPEVERQVLAKAQISAPAAAALVKMARPKVEFTITGEPVESPPGSNVWAVPFAAYVRDGDA